MFGSGTRNDHAGIDNPMMPSVIKAKASSVVVPPFRLDHFGPLGLKLTVVVSPIYVSQKRRHQHDG